MNLYVWRGERVLKNYSSGLVVVAAETEEAAWEKLRVADFRIWYWLRTGVSYVFCESDITYSDPEDIEYTEPLKPEVFTVETLPCLWKVGGE